MSKKVRLAIIGCGGMAKGHLNAYKTLKNKGIDTFTVAALCDPQKERAEEFSAIAVEFQGIAPVVYTDVGEMLNREELDAADICTPHSDHHVSGIACLESGVDVMIEKPIGVTVKASRKIIEAAEKNNRIVATAENIRRCLGQRTMYWAINEQKLIGQPRMFFAQHASWRVPPPDTPWAWRCDRLIGGGGMIMDSGAHYMDSLRYFFGDVDKVYAEVRSLEKRTCKHETKGIVPWDVEDSWMATFTFKSGLIGVWSCTWAAPGTTFNRVMYYGSEGSIEDKGDVFHGFMRDAEVKLKDDTTKSLQDLKVEFLLSLDEGKKQKLFPYGITDGVILECYDFIDAVCNRRRPEIDGWDGLKAKAMSEAIFESSWCGQAVKVDDVIDGKVEGYQKAINKHWGL